MKPHKRLKFDRNTCTWIWWHISAITCHLIMSTSQNFMLTCQIIMSTCQKNVVTTRGFISCFFSVLMPVFAIYFSIKYPTCRHHYLTSRHKDLTSDIQNVITEKLCFQTIISTCQILYRLAR